MVNDLARRTIVPEVIVKCLKNIVEGGGVFVFGFLTTSQEGFDWDVGFVHLVV